MVVGWQLGSYLPHYGGPHGTRYGYGKMVCVCACVHACVCVCVCVCVCLSASLQHSAQQPNLKKTQLQTAQKPPAVPGRTAHWMRIRLFGLVHDAAKQCISLSP